MIRILLDSSADFSREEYLAQGMEMFSLHVHLAGRDYTGCVDLNMDAFSPCWRKAQSSCARRSHRRRILSARLKRQRCTGDELICILLSSGLSALLARDMVNHEGIYIVDSLYATGGIQIPARHAAVSSPRGRLRRKS